MFVAVAAVLAVRAVQGVRETRTETDTEASAMAANEVARLANSIAVLPFANISSDPENEYFCDGISEEILNEISAVRHLNVIGRTSSFAFKGSNTRIERISAVLGVQYVLQGSVRKAGTKLRISAQLLDERGRQLWTQTFDRELAGAIIAFERAIKLDPDFAEAHAEWAIARSMGYPSQQHLDSADAAIDRALKLKSQLLRAQAARGLWLLQSRPPDAGAAESVLRSVLEQDPNMSDAMLWLSTSLGMQGREEESLEILQRGSRIDPLHPSITGNLATALFERGEDEEALALLTRQLQQPFPGGRSYLALRDAFRLRGRLVELNAVAKDQALHAADQYFSLALSYALLGDPESAEYWIERSLKDYPDWPLNPYYGAIVPNWRGNQRLARQRFEQGMEAAGIDIDNQDTWVRIWYAGLLARSGDYTAAINLIEPQATVDVTPGSLNLDVAPELDGWHALAWSYRHTGAEAKAAGILSQLLENCRSKLGDARTPAHSDLLHYCAETALMAGDTERALTLLERAIDAGWRDYYLRQDDPCWSALEKDPRYLDLMAAVKADVDRQRAEVQHIDATDDFKARLNAAIAAGQETAQ